ncbi:MAG: hypothetical protein JO135_05475 [Candidatus Eremiobacteraeota bacterium]|nr:hypothetical protein [Candidatus Eremiobacteraeota bacterium]
MTSAAIPIFFTAALSSAILCGVGTTNATAAALDEPPIAVSTFAGTGRAGSRDGSLRTAEFIAPSAIAVAADGSIYVCDAGSDTIRLIRGASVTTVAGNANGKTGALDGFQDGPARSAAFNRPAGIAVMSDGVVFIADTFNHAIRVLRAGVVSTLAGGPANAGSADGPAAQAEFVQPRGLALDGMGNLYVADFGNGVRRVTPSGEVRTILALKDATGVAIGGSRLYVAALSGMTIYDLGTSAVVQTTPVSATPLGAVQGETEPGFPYSIAAYNDHEVVYGDLRTNTVRYSTENYFRVLAGIPQWDPENTAGGSANGPSDLSRFNAPMGVATRRDGSVVVADAGNHVIRLISRWNRTFAVLPNGANLESFTTKPVDDTIAWLGNSAVWSDSTWSQSIPGMVQTGLQSRLKRTVRVIPVVAGVDLRGVVSFVQTYFTTGLVRCVVLQVNSGYQYWEPTLESALVEIKRSLDASHVQFIAIIHPGGSELSPVESLYFQLRYAPSLPADLAYLGRYDAAEAQRRHSVMVDAVKAVGVKYADAWPDFERAESIEGSPLFGTSDVHFTYRARQIMARVGIEALQRYYYAGLVKNP